MSVVALLVTVCLPQSPDSPPPPSVTADVIRLDVGSEVEGTIVRETADYVEIRLAEGMVVGFAKSRAVAILRGAAQPPAAQQASIHGAGREDAPQFESGSAFVERSQWYAVHDAQGRVIGSLHETRGPDRTSGGFRYGEEWRFADGERATEITVLETLDAERRPQSCFYHERVRDAADRVVVDRIVRGTVADGRLQVSRQSMRGSEKREYEFADNARFPLELLASLRAARAANTIDAELFDPSVEEWRSERFDVGGERTVEHEGARIRVRVLSRNCERRGAADEATIGCEIEWLDAADTPLRRELNGPALVALPSTETRIRDMLTRTESTYAPALASEASGRFGLWLPNPMWTARAERHGEITARNATFDTSIQVVLLDQLGPDVLLETAVDSVERWLRLAHPDLEFGARRRLQLPQGSAMRLLGEYEVRVPGSPALRRVCDVTVIGAPFAAGGYLSFCADAPKSALREIGGDLSRALCGLELRAEQLAAPSPPLGAR